MGKKTIELLAPGGDAQSIKAAILAGADAVYLGVGEFNARKRAVNIAPGEVRELSLIAHQRQVRLYVTLNILIFEDEFPVLTDLLGSIVDYGIDAVIIQDYGLLQYVRRTFPDLEVHASTQMTTHNSGQLKFLAQTGVTQVNFSRELSSDELIPLTGEAHAEGLKAEVFVHGAYCVSFSGQCYMSGILYENSANRGACVQPCRRSYQYTQGEGGRGRSKEIKPLNLKDNSVLSWAADLYFAGVDSFKIEGRIKGHEYVYSTVLTWREQLERLYAGGAPEEKDARLSAVFNRDFSDNLIQGRLAEDSFTQDSTDRSLSPSGMVIAYNAGDAELIVSRDAQLASGQKITIREGSDRFICTGTLMEQTGSNRYHFRIEHRLMGKIKNGQQILSQARLIDYSALDDSISAMTAEPEKTALHFSLQGKAGTPLELTARCGGTAVSCVSDSFLEKATGHPTSFDSIEKQLARLGNTQFYLASCDISGLEKGLFIPVKMLNGLRRKAVASLNEDSTDASPARVQPELIAGEFPAVTRIAVAVSDKNQLKQILSDRTVLPIFQLPADPEVLSEVQPLFDAFPTVIPWFPSILIGPQYTAACDFLLESGIRQLITDNSGIAFFAREHGIAWIAGPLLNAANGYALSFFHENGAAGAFCSAEMNTQQFSSMTVPPGMELWSFFAAPDFLMKSRHCIVRNCQGCDKEVMDARCLPDCSRQANMIDSAGNEILVIKKRGDYNGLYRKGLRIHSDRLNDPRVSTWLLDFRVWHRSMLPDCSIQEFIEIGREKIRKAVPLHKFPAGKPQKLARGGRP